MNKRNVVRWKNGERVEIKDVTPTPFGPCRADQIWSHREYADFPYDAATDGELAFIHEVWDTMPGSSCFMDAFSNIAQGRVNLKEFANG